MENEEIKHFLKMLMVEAPDWYRSEDWRQDRTLDHLCELFKEAVVNVADKPTP